jgi:hypothetical protein
MTKAGDGGRFDEGKGSRNKNDGKEAEIVSPYS